MAGQHPRCWSVVVRLLSPRQGEEERVREVWWVAGDRDTKGGGECKVFTSSRATTARQKGEEEGEALRVTMVVVGPPTKGEREGKDEAKKG